MVSYTADGYLLCNGCTEDLTLAEDHDEHVAAKSEGFKDEQRKCAGCGLQVNPVTGNHINELPWETTWKTHPPKTCSATRPPRA